MGETKRVLPSDTCADCRFWRSSVERGSRTFYYECWRYPKIAHRLPFEWCGEYVFSGREALRKTS